MDFGRRGFCRPVLPRWSCGCVFGDGSGWNRTLALAAALAANGGFLYFGGRRKPEIPVFQNHRRQRHQQYGQRNEHAPPLRFGIWRRRRQREGRGPLQMILKLRFVVIRRHQEFRDIKDSAGRTQLHQRPDGGSMPLIKRLCQANPRLGTVLNLDFLPRSHGDTEKTNRLAKTQLFLILRVRGFLRVSVTPW